MHALSTQRKANMGDDVNYFPIEGQGWGLGELGGLGEASSSPLFNIFREEWHVNDYQLRGHIPQTDMHKT